jgi:hypothetical protein
MKIINPNTEILNKSQKLNFKSETTSAVRLEHRDLRFEICLAFRISNLEFGGER